jgi:hypothetical protein
MRLNLRIPLFLTLVVASVGIGTVGVHASTDCQHLFRSYTDQIAKHLHHKISPETLARWAAWNKAHPHYRPTKKEAIDKINFVCQVPMDDADLAQDLPPISLPPVLPALTDTIITPPSNSLVSNLVPPDNPLQPPVGEPEFGPVYYPGPPSIFGGNSSPTPPVSPTPEPASLLLMTTALGLLAGLMFWKRQQSEGLMAQTSRS